MQQTAAQRGPRRRASSPTATRRVFQRDGRGAQLLQRRFHPHHRAAPPPRLPGDLAAHGRRPATSTRTAMPAGTRCATRPITTRPRPTVRRRRRPLRAAGHAGRMGGGGELLLPPLRLSGPAARALRGAIRTSSARDERRNEVVSFVKGGLQRPLDLAHDLRLGHPGAGRPEARDVCLGRRADQLHHRRRLSRRERAAIGASGRPTSTSSARTSSASTRSTGRPS